MEYYLSQSEAINRLKKFKTELDEGTSIVIGYETDEAYLSTKFRVNGTNIDIDIENLEIFFSTDCYEFGNNDYIQFDKNVVISFNNILKCFEISMYKHYDFFFSTQEKEYAFAKKRINEIDEALENLENRKLKIIKEYNENYGKIQSI